MTTRLACTLTSDGKMSAISGTCSPAHVHLPSFPFLPNDSLLKLFKDAPWVFTSTLETGTCVFVAEACAGRSGEAVGSCGMGVGVCCRKPVSCGGTMLMSRSTDMKARVVDCLIPVNKKMDTYHVKLDLQDSDVSAFKRSGSWTQD